jgi:TPR repeat protein
MYGNGIGVPQDCAEAAKWYLLSADQGYSDAQFNLGFMYDSGTVVPQDFAEAVRWYRLAADQGYDMAQDRLGVMYDNGTGVPQDYVEAAKWYRLAADQGLAWAQYKLGVMYETGTGVPQDNAQAEKWYRLANDKGHANAQYRRDMMSGGSRDLKVIITLLVGALVVIGLLRRLSNLIMRRVGAKPWGWSHLIVGIIAVVGGAFGFADGGPPAWQLSASYFLPTTALWLWFDFFAEKRRRSA